MIIISEKNWIEISRVFLDAFEQFWNEGTETQMIELNNRQIEISFFEQELCDPHRFNVVLFRPDVDKIVESSFDQASHDTTEIIQMMYQLAWLTKQPYSFRITTNNCEEEYEQIREILFNVYYDCFEEFSIADPYETYVLRHMIKFHNQRIFLHFTRGEMFDINGSIDVSIHCYPSDKECSGVICQNDPAPEEIIQMIRNLAWEEVTTVKQLIIAEHDDIYGIVEHFMGHFDIPSIGNDSLESLEYWAIKSEYLSQDPTATVPNVRFLTTAGIVDLYFYFNAFDMRIPDVESINLINPPPKEGDSCVVFALNGEYRKYLYYDAHWFSSIIDTDAPAVANSIYCAIYSAEEEDNSTGQ